MLVHNSPKPLIALEDRSAAQTVAPKPTGLWLSEGADWVKWCASAAMMSERVYPHFAQVDPGADTRILKLEGAQDISDFSREYGSSKHSFPWYQRTIDWSKVASDFDGIHALVTRVTDEQGDSATPFWLHGWDVPSACIWRPGKEARISRVPVLTVLKWMEEVQRIKDERSIENIVEAPETQDPSRTPPRTM